MMAFDKLKMDISMLLTEMENRPHDRHELHEMLREKLNEIRAFGMPLPDDLLQLERRLAAEFSADRTAGTK